MEEKTMACSKKSCGKTKELSAEHQKILSAMAAKAEPCGCKDIASDCDMESKSVSCKLKTLKSRGYIDSPARCKYAITEAGKTALSAS